MKALVMCSKKSNPDIILIIFFTFFLFCLQSKIITKMQNSYQSEQEQNTKVSNNS